MRSDRHTLSGADAPVGDPSGGRSDRLLDGRYRIGPKIARGGMATVYEATDVRLDRTVAVKIMHPGLGDDDAFAARFVSEARAAARLSHPHVVSVYDQGNDGGTVFLAMELVRGHTLRDTIARQAPLPPARALALLDPVVSALAAAHRAGLVHRDVKPENVLISDAGELKVADFGLARAVSADTRHTATGVLLGTVSYVAPEIVLDGRADARADVYAVGVILYELLTGEKPHDGETAIQVAYRHVHTDVPPPSALVPGLPAYVDALVARATARDRAQRPADAGVLLHLMHRVVAALRSGDSDDPELVADLRPVRRDPGEAEPTAEEDLRGHPTIRTRVAPLPSEDSVGSPTPAEPTRTWAATPPASDTPRTRGRRRWRGPLAVLLALLLAGGVGAGAWWYGWARYTSTPAVLGLSRTEAEQRLTASGLELVLADPEFSSTVPKGDVLRSEPAPGERVLDGGEVTVVLSQGVEQYRVRGLRGLTEDQAQDALHGAHMTFGESVEAWSEDVPEGRVIRSEPAAGRTFRPGTVFDLVISKGRQPIEVGDWIGRPLEEAEDALAARGLEPEVTGEKYHDTVPEGHVIGQTPEGGTLHRGDAVQLVVSQGPELVEVPRVVASGEKDAEETLEALGFEVETERSDSYVGLHFVVAQSHDPGEMVPKGTTITLYLV